MSNEMNEAYKKAIAILSEVKVEQADPSHGSTAHKRTMGGSQKAKEERQKWQRRAQASGQRQTDRFRPGMSQLAHTDPILGPSLHETYERLISIILEYKKRSKEDWERVRLGSELIDPTGKPLTGQQRRKISLTKERADRKKAAKRKKAAAKRAKAKKKAPAPDPNHGWSVADEPLHYL